MGVLSVRQIVSHEWSLTGCLDSCLDYVGYTSRHLHQRIDEHRKKYQGKLDCLIFEMLWIRKKRPSLNTQSDSIRAKLFV